MKFYKISETDLRRLLTDAYRFQALECGGVDNWEWYSEAFHDFVEECSKDEEKEYEDIDEIAEDSLKYYEEII